MPLKEIGMRVEFLAGAAGVLLADLTQVVLNQMVQHVFAVGKGRFALRTRVSRHLVAVIGLQVSRQVFPERLEVLQSGAALTAEKGTSGVAAAATADAGIRGGPVSGVFVREIRRFRHVSAPLQPRVSRDAVVDAVYFRLPVLHRGSRRGPTILTVLENIVLGVGSCGRARDAAQWAHHHRRAERAEPVYRQQMFAQAAQRGELHGALVARERVLVVVPLAGSLLSVFRVFPILRRRAVLTIQRLVARARGRLFVRSAGRRRYSQTLAAQDRLMHRVHVHLQLLHAAERVFGTVHAGQLQGGTENRRGGRAAGALRSFQGVSRV